MIEPCALIVASMCKADLWVDELGVAFAKKTDLRTQKPSSVTPYARQVHVDYPQPLGAAEALIQSQVSIRYRYYERGQD